MAKSWIVGGRNTGESLAAGGTDFIRVGSSIEAAGVVQTIRSRFPEAGVVRNFAFRIGANTLSVDLVVTVRLNDTSDTALSVTFETTDADAEKYDTADSVSISADDDIVIKAVRAAGTGSALAVSNSIEFEPTNESNCLSHFSTQTASSSNPNTPGTTVFFPAFGQRVFDTTEASGADAGMDWECIGSFDAVYFSVSSGTITFDADTVCRTRKNGSNGNAVLTFTPDDDSVTKYDTSNTDSLADGDTFCYSVTPDAGGSGGNVNIENLQTWLRSTAGQFLLAAANRNGERVLDGLTRYFCLGGEMDEQSVGEGQAQQRAPFDMTVTAMQVRSDREVMTGDTTVTLRKGGSDTELAVTFDNATTGNLEDTGAVSVTGGTDALATEAALGTGTNRDFNYIVYLAEAVAEADDVIVEPVVAALTLAGLAPVAAIGIAISPTTSTLVIQAQSPSVAIGIAPSTTTAALVLAGQAPASAVGIAISPATSALVIQGQSPSVTVGIAPSTTEAALVLAGQQPTITVAGDAIVEPLTAALSLSGQTPVSAVGVAASPSTSTLIVQTQSPGVVVGVAPSTITASLILTGQQPTIAVAGVVIAEPLSAELTLGGQAPGATIGIAPSTTTAALVLAGQTPTVLVGELVIAEPATAALVMAGAAPTPAVGIAAVPDTAALAISGQAPVVLAGGAIVAIPETAALALVSSTPSVTVGAVTTTMSAALVLAGKQPTVVAEGVAFFQTTTLRGSAVYSSTLLGSIK